MDRPAEAQIERIQTDVSELFAEYTTADGSFALPIGGDLVRARRV